MTTKENFLQNVLFILAVVSLVNCAPAQTCPIAGANKIGHLRPAATSTCGGGGGGGGTCSSTLMPTQVMLSTDGTGNMLEFGIDSTTAALTLMCNTGTAAIGPVVVTPNNLFAYVLDVSAGNQIFGFQIAHSKSGALAAIAMSPFQLPEIVSGATIAVDPLNRFVFVTNFGQQDVHVLAIGQSGALTEVVGSPFTVSNPTSIAITPSGSFAYVTDLIDGDIFIFSLGADGSLTSNPASNSPFIIQTGVNDHPQFALVHPTANLLFTANAESVSAYIIDPTHAGALSLAAGSPVQTGSFQIEPLAVVLDKSGLFLYVTPAGAEFGPGGFQSDNIMGYQVDTTAGGLTQIANAPFTSTSTLDIVANPLGSQMFVESITTTSASIQVESIDANGNLTASGTPLTVTANAGVGVLAIANIQ